MTKYRLIVAGGRDFTNYKRLSERLNYFTTYIDLNDLVVISGKARGADSLGEKWANDVGVKVVEFPADWNKHGKSAGYIRNEQMAKYAVEGNSVGVLVAFWDGESRGTKHMIDLAEKYGMNIRVVRY